MRIDAVVTATYVVTLAAPLACYASIRLARERRHDPHRLVQAVVLATCWIAVLALELRIRFAGGSGAFLELAHPALAATARTLLGVHISVAVATYLVWTWLATASWRRHTVTLPGSFSRTHRALGMAVFGGLCFTAASATGMYVLVFVA
jgi:putative membrane protein